jgi:hypothetical protein
MGDFQFWSLSAEECARLRNDPNRCISLLSACKRLSTKLATMVGIDTLSDSEDELLLQGFHRVQLAFMGYEHEGEFDELCHRASSLPSDAGLLAGRVESLYQQREPALYEAETIAISFHCSSEA